MRRDRCRASCAATTLLADAVASSVDEHARFGGVVPEVASRAHLEAMVPTIERACATAGRAAAATSTRSRSPAVPGWPARCWSASRRPRRWRSALGKPLYGVNHLAAHVAVDQLEHGPLPEPCVGAARVRRALRRCCWSTDVTADVEPLGRDDRRRRGRGVRQGRAAARAAVPRRPAHRPGGARRRPGVRSTFPRGLTGRRDLSGTATTSRSPG